ncbi:hypothetical protein GCM10017782_21050 [Deinococcus ficus]|nr:hypothetical protein GCM10017782_21050 [Deinococcus ficus]
MRAGYTARMNVRTGMLSLLALAAVSTPASAAALWAGGNVTTAGFGVHAGAALLPIPFIGTLGVEGTGERAWNADTYRFAAGVTLRDLNVPLTNVDLFATLGAEVLTGAASGAHAYTEAGLRGPLFGPAGWRVFGRASTSGQFGAGLGLELRF